MHGTHLVMGMPGYYSSAYYDFSKTTEVTKKGQGDIILMYQPFLPPCAQVGKTPFNSELVLFSSDDCPVGKQWNMIPI